MDNPFSLVRASDYTNEQINSLWVELGENIIDTIIEPKLKISKFILGGKGSGKTHLLRYYSYPVVRLRNTELSGLETIKKQGFLAVFLRATGLDAARFETGSGSNLKWTQLFAIYLELRLAEAVLNSLCDIAASSDENFNDEEFIKEIGDGINNKDFFECSNVADVREWAVNEKKKIDEAVNNAAFTDTLDVKIPFSLGSLCLALNHALYKWCPNLKHIPVIYLIDEIENFSVEQQKVVNTLIRYGEGYITFRISGRLYSRKTSKTLGDGEENREGSEYKITQLDYMLRNYKEFNNFAKRFISKRFLATANINEGDIKASFDPSLSMDVVSSNDYFLGVIEKLDFEDIEALVKSKFHNALYKNGKSGVLLKEVDEIVETLTVGFPLILQKLNFLIFCKRINKADSYIGLAHWVKEQASLHMSNSLDSKDYYFVSYSHYSYDLLAQITKESKNSVDFPYAGFDTFVKMSSGNMRSLLIILGRLFAIAKFKGVDFGGPEKLSVEMQTEAAIESAQFLYESDSNFGEASDKAREAVLRLAQLLRTARYALNIPEVSPITVSFSDSDLNETARFVLNNALNYSFVFEISSGRPDRNSQRINRKIQLNPLLSPKWGLPVGRRGDLSLNAETLNSIFDQAHYQEFKLILAKLRDKWNDPFKKSVPEVDQGELF
ncbi:hypothetical protein [Vreelandella neptunia]|uniref:Uncharacterized protein n=1 Tax=Vreelandella neptunia TaxID=115551 RepID=A0ABZ0YNN2_9GAMM|nr:hypothetical protein [Halomonas neptunia]MDN3558611.1 hypothetical protein [Halomonas neptunia]WQH13581.1 hypothetical protein SR894_03335 [Halomonas neptunia]